jgi:hypothetical protein
MDPKKGDSIRILFKNNVNIKGIVVLWSNDKVVLESTDGGSFLIIYRPLEEILFVQITYENSKKKQEVKKIDNDTNKPANDLELQKLVDLRKMLIAQEKQNIAEKLRDHNIGPVTGVTYENPSFFKKTTRKKT